MPRLTIAVLITARAMTPGTRNSTGSSSPVGRMSTSPKNTSNSIGMTIISSNCSPLRRVVTSSLRNWMPSSLTRCRPW